MIETADKKRENQIINIGLIGLGYIVEVSG